ncbi:MAG: hypothetical protein ACWA6U_10665 [Breznakibacter sp.]
MKSLLIALFATLSLGAVAQYTFPEKALLEEMQNRTLAVQLLEGNDEPTTHLNNALKEVFLENWKWSPVEFHTVSQIESILKDKNTKYAVLSQQDALREIVGVGHMDSQGRVSHVGGGIGNPGFAYSAFTFSYYNFKLALPTTSKPVTITKIGFANGDLSRIDYLFLAQQLNWLISASLNEVPGKEFFNVERNIEECKSKKIAFLKDFFKEKKLNKVGEYYEHPHELVDFDQYQDIILSKKPGYAYNKIIWSTQLNMYAWIVADAETGRTISLLTFGGVKFGRHHDANDIIKISHLKYITSKMQSINNKYN